MTLLFIGGEDCDGIINTSNVVGTTAGTFNSTYARLALAAEGSSNTLTPASLVQTPVVAQQIEFWVRTRIATPGTTIVNSGAVNTIYSELMRLDDGSGRAVLRLAVQYQTGITRMETVSSDGSAFVVRATGPILSSTSTLYVLDIGMRYALDGWARFYVNGALWMEWIGDTRRSDAAGIARARFASISQSSAASGRAWFSEIAVANSDTRGIVGIATLVPSGSGALSAWSGAAADISETTLSDATFINTATPAAQSSFTLTDTPAGASASAISAVCVSARALRGASGPSQLTPGLRLGGTVYNAASSALSLGPGTVQSIWSVNPATSGGWTKSAVDGLELTLTAGT